jgi:hypothetical protein
MSLLNKQAETKLIGAIENAAALVNSGMQPNDAIIKSATDSGIPPGHIDLMVHAYNTGRTTKQREQGENTLEKAADFQLANIDDIRSKMFGATVKTSAEIKTQQVVSTEYALNPVAMIKRANKMAAPAPAPFKPEFTPPPRDEHEVARRAYSEKRASHWQAEEDRRKVTESYNKTAAKFDELVTYFRTPGHVAYPDAVKDVQLAHGEHGALVMQKLANLYPTVQKEAGTNVRIITDVTARNLVGDILDLVDSYNELAAKQAAKTASAQDDVKKKLEPEICTGSILFRAEDEPLTLKEAGIDGLDTMRVRGEPSWKNRYSRGYWDQPTSQEQKVIVDPSYTPTAAELARGFQAGFRPFGLPKNDVENQRQRSDAKPSAPAGGGKGKTDGYTGMLGAIANPAIHVGGLMGMGAENNDKPTNEIKGKAQYNTISDADQDATIKNIRAKSVLHDLILNDPIVSGHDPQDVAMAFNDIAELAPNLVDTPGMLQTVLRKRLESGQLADFDVKQILEMDKLRAERDKIQGEARRINMESM